MNAHAREHHEFIDQGGVRTHYYVWRVPHSRGVVQIVHGLGDHALRYEDFAQALCAAGYSVYAHDQRGHGATGMEQHGGDRSKLGRLGSGGLTATIASIREMTEIVKRENPGAPIVLVAQSWGSLMVQMMLNQEMAAYSGAILIGTAYRVLGGMDAGDLSRRHRPKSGANGYEWLSRDVATQEAAAADPLMFPPNVLKLFGVADGLRLFGRPGRNVPHDMPVLIAVGDDDTLGGRRSGERLAEKYRKRSHLTDVELAVYGGARHELLGETNKDEVIADMIAWIDEHVPKGRGERAR